MSTFKVLCFPFLMLIFGQNLPIFEFYRRKLHDLYDVIPQNDKDLRIVNEWSHQSDEHKKALRFSDVVPAIK